MTARHPAAVIVASLLCAMTVRSLAQDRPRQPPSFRTGIDLVHVDVSVLDSGGRPVRGLIRPEDMPWARRTAEAAVNQLGPGDLAAVVFADTGVPQNFTADRSLLLAAIRRPYLGLAIEAEAETARRGICYCGVCTHEQMTLEAKSGNTTVRRDVRFGVR